MVRNRPVLMNNRQTLIDQIGHTIEMRWDMVAHIYGRFSKPPAKLRYVGNGRTIELPESILVECLYPLTKSNLDIIGQEVVLAQ